jgi:broad specificity phosphatase PhoE
LPTTILLIRHAEHDDFGRRLSGRGRGVGLSASGLRQAGALAASMAALPLASVHCSPRKRALHTARRIAAACGTALRIEPALDEVDFGSWSGLSFAELDRDPAWRRWNEARGTERAPGGESMAEVARRAVAALDRLAARAGTAMAAAVTHADVIRGVVAHYLGLPMDNLLRFDADPASVSRLALYPGGGRVLSVNESPFR